MKVYIFVPDVFSWCFVHMNTLLVLLGRDSVGTRSPGGVGRTESACLRLHIHLK